MEININNLQNKVPIEEEFYTLINDVILKAASIENIKESYEISITITDNEYIKEVNNNSRNVDAATDVLSFPMVDFNYAGVYDEFDINNENDCIMLGDIIFSIEKAKTQADEYGHSLKREIAFLTVHGFLHLLGYTHYDSVNENKMFSKQDEILNELQIFRNI